MILLLLLRRLLLLLKMMFFLLLRFFLPSSPFSLGYTNNEPKTMEALGRGRQRRKRESKEVAVVVAATTSEHVAATTTATTELGLKQWLLPPLCLWPSAIVVFFLAESSSTGFPLLFLRSWALFTIHGSACVALSMQNSAFHTPWHHLTLQGQTAG